MNFALVGVGGMIGALMRFSLSRWIGERVAVSFPLATLIINVSGAFLLGYLTRNIAVWIHGSVASSHALLLLGTGLCGAYTTFSTFSYEIVILARERRFAAAILYLSSTMLFGFAACAIGLYGLPVAPGS